MNLIKKTMKYFADPKSIGEWQILIIPIGLILIVVVTLIYILFFKGGLSYLLK